MISQSFEIYKELDPNKKDAKWADGVITLLRRDARPLIDPARIRSNKQYLYSQHSMQHIEEKFKDKKFRECTNFRPLGLLESIRNTLAEEITKVPPKVELRATDPIAISEKATDIQLLKNRKIVEGDINKYQGQVMGKNAPKYKYGYNKFQSNVQEFDKMGLNENDNDDINFYEQNFQRLKYEIAGQDVVNNVLKTSRFDEDNIKNLVDDILAARVACMQSYVDQLTGEIKNRYVYPETAWGIFGDANDGRDDTARGWQDNKTVLEWLQMAGNDFDFTRDWRHLLWAINYATGYKFTGFVRNAQVFDVTGTAWGMHMGLEGQQQNLCEWTLAWTYKIYVGYIEWNTLEATSTFLKSHSDINFSQQVPYNYELEKKVQVKEYYKESNYQQQYYRSYFIATTSISQWIYGFQKIYHQQLEGSNDEYAVGTCIFYRQQGMSAVEIVKEFIDMVELTWYKIKWLVYKAKPQEEEYLYDELIQIAKGFQKQFPQTSTSTAPTLQNILQQAIQYQRENTVRIRFFPQVDGKTQAQVPQFAERKNGLDALAGALQGIFVWAKQYIAEEIGFNAMRTGMNPPSRESFKSESQTIQSSYNSTGYFYRMIEYVKERIATTSLMYAQDIIHYKDSIPYNWLKRIVGEQSFVDLQVLENFAAHRYGIFIRDYSSEQERQRILQAADMALQKGQIKIDAWGIINRTEDTKKALQILSYIELKAEKKLRKQQLQDAKIKDEMDEKNNQRELKLIMAKGKVEYEKTKLMVDGQVKVAELNNEGKKEVKQLTIDAEPQKQAGKGETQKEIAEKKQALKEQVPYPAVAEA